MSRASIHCAGQVWQPGEAEARTPRVFCWGVCRPKLDLQPSQDLPTPRATPQLSIPGFCFWADWLCCSGVYFTIRGTTRAVG
jgi:hypothetical protein